MNFLKLLRDGAHGGALSHDSVEANSADDEEFPVVVGYDRLNERDALAELPGLTQVELAGIEAFERSHRDRPAVLDKLRYLRQAEPLPGYDALDATGIAHALSTADLAAVKAVREYERKAKNRAAVLTEVSRALHRCGEDQRAAALHRAETLAGETNQPPVVGNGLPVRSRATAREGKGSSA
jgi:hypothetical protein